VLADANATNETSNGYDLSKGLSFLCANLSGSNKVDGANDHLYHFLGICPDILGFTSDGDLEFAFDPHTPHYWSSEQRLTGSS
jgi:hypothetical protein